MESSQQKLFYYTLLFILFSAQEVDYSRAVAEYA